uniref:acylaminoacyl-peptidase n=1 Tax=Romanomermis culicivorax TaxID=13658 RepID=A0A915JJ33_ROMCU
FKWATKEDAVIVDVVKNYVTDPKTFPGIYEGSLPERCWALDNNRVLIETIWRSKTEIVVINVQTGDLAAITNKGERYGSWRLLDVYQDFVLASNSAPNRPPSLFLARLPPIGRESSDIAWHKLDSEMPRQFDQLISDLFWDVLTLRRENDVSEPVEFNDMQYESILHLPSSKKGSTDKLPPLIAIAHGGPHSTSVATWLPHVAFFVFSGYAVLRINYRGSLGFGDDFVNALPGRIGKTDVLDCKHAIDVALDRLTSVANENTQRQVFLYGGSHGGFLTAHLIGQYPGFAKAAVAINPVLNLASKVFETDIPDWNVFETFATAYNPADKINGEQLAKMLEKSPIHYVDSVITPLMVAIGENDMRVPCAQIKKYTEILRARKVPLRVMCYPGNNHAIANIDAEANEIINALLWFDSYCQ